MGSQVSLLDEKQDAIKKTNPLPVEEASSEAILEVAGNVGDNIVNAGAVGTLSAKIRRLTADLDALLTKVGEVQASPTANTILARLKDIKDGVTLTGSSPEVSSDQDTQVATTVQTYNRPAGASQIELYVETGYVRVRTDGQPCTGTTGEPIAAGFGSAWRAESISVYYIQESVITVVSR